MTKSKEMFCPECQENHKTGDKPLFIYHFVGSMNRHRVKAHNLTLDQIKEKKRQMETLV